MQVGPDAVTGGKAEDGKAVEGAEMVGKGGLGKGVEVCRAL